MEISRDGEERQKNNWPFNYFKFDQKRDSADQVRSAILVVAALVATASFQAIMTPPDAIKRVPIARMIIFICANTLACSSSMTITGMLVETFPFQREIRISFLSMAFVFGLAAGALANFKGIGSYIAFLICSFLPWASRAIPACKKRP